MIGVCGTATNQIAQNTGSKTAVDNALPGVSFMDSIKEIAKGYMGRIEGVGNLSVKEMDFLKAKLEIEDQELGFEDDEFDLFTSFKQRVIKILNQREVK